MSLKLVFFWVKMTCLHLKNILFHNAECSITVLQYCITAALQGCVQTWSIPSTPCFSSSSPSWPPPVSAKWMDSRTNLRKTRDEPLSPRPEQGYRTWPPCRWHGCTAPPPSPVSSAGAAAGWGPPRERPGSPEVGWLDGEYGIVKRWVMHQTVHWSRLNDF